MTGEIGMAEEEEASNVAELEACAGEEGNGAEVVGEGLDRRAGCGFGFEE